MPTPNGMPTWEDFPQFYNNPVIKQLANNERWSVSTTKSPDPTKKNKMPIDMHAFITEQKVWGASFTRGYNPYVTLQTVCETIPNAINNAYYLDALIDKFVVLDVEPKCPDEIKRQFLAMPYLYGETSMSGNGLHLIFRLPEEIMNKYPNAQNKMTLQEENGYYEILLNHMVTFTRNVIAPSNIDNPITTFEEVFEYLAQEAKPSVTAQNVIVTDITEDDIPHYDLLQKQLSNLHYSKSLTDFPQKGSKTGYNNSSYEFGMSGFYYRALNSLLKDNTYKDHEYSDEEKAYIIYKRTTEELDYRPKHDELRSGMPWLLYIATCSIAKSDI